MKGKINRRNFLKLTGKGALIWAASGIIAPNTLWASSLPKEVLIGAILPLTGGLATTGDEIKSGMELAVSKINGKGGIAGKSKIKLFYEDTRCNPTEAAIVTNRIIAKHKVHFMVGMYCSSVALAAMPILDRAKIPNITSGYAEAITGKSHKPGTFRIGPQAKLEMPIIAKFAIQERKKKKFAILALNNDWGHSMAEWFKKTANKLGGEVTGTLLYKFGTRDFRSQLTKIKGMGVDGIVAINLTPSNISFTEQYHELDMKQDVFCADTFNDRQYKNMIAKKGLATNFFFPFFFNENSKDPFVQDFVKSYKKKYGYVPGRNQGWGYGEVMLLVQAVEGAKSIKPDKIIKYFHNHKFNTPFGKYGFGKCGQSEVRTGIATYDAKGNRVFLKPQGWGKDVLPPIC
ncbi:MAG: ABC transporter substrate-binding protein [Deltaproteobacteria bacterium]|nr:ABC transporter substrate-binding protein [Deltaproteobacteria bacterium]